MESTKDTQQAWFLMSSYPVLFPFHEALTKPQSEFDNFIQNELKTRHDAAVAEEGDNSTADKAMTDAAESETAYNPDTLPPARCRQHSGTENHQSPHTHND